MIFEKNYFIDERWKDIAKGHTILCIGGGPSAREYDQKKLNYLINNNFSITVNHSIKAYQNVSMYFTGDNLIVRKYFNNGDFEIKDQLYSKPYKVTPENQFIINKNLIKVLVTQDWSSENYGLNGGQIFHSYAMDYAKKFENVWIAREFKTNKGSWSPAITEDWPEVFVNYGQNMQDIHAGGNVMSDVLQLLWFMGFDKVILIGVGDIGNSFGYGDNSNSFIWGDLEKNVFKLHFKMWSKKNNRRIKMLSGGEILKKIIDIDIATKNDFSNDIIKKNKLEQKIKSMIELPGFYKYIPMKKEVVDVKAITIAQSLQKDIPEYTPEHGLKIGSK